MTLWYIWRFSTSMALICKMMRMIKNGTYLGGPHFKWWFTIYVSPRLNVTLYYHNLWLRQITCRFSVGFLQNTCQCMKSDDEKSAESTHQNWHAAFHLSFPRGFTKLGFPEKVENTRHFSTTFSFRLSAATYCYFSDDRRKSVKNTYFDFCRKWNGWEKKSFSRMIWERYYRV